ncbi:MAG: glucosamine-6-phosphate deaminase [Acholeplasmataceae bacterium]|nr:glucosamine-6-phosphate deaminase [Acholeplasmataceae bacterium]
MNLVIVRNYEEMSAKASQIIGTLLKKQPDAVLGLATGSTPIGLYTNLIKMYENKEISFSNVKTYNLDEYCDLPKEHPQTYFQFMWKNLFDHIDIKKENVHIPDGNTANHEQACKEYNELLKQIKIDLQVLGIGSNGHIGFNEPGTPFEQETFIVKLSENTRKDNQRFFASLSEVPQYAITMGIHNIMQAEKIVLLASGKAKAEAIKNLVEGEISIDFPASVLKLHHHTIVIVDEEAASLLNK